MTITDAELAHAAELIANAAQTDAQVSLSAATLARLLALIGGQRAELAGAQAEAARLREALKEYADEDSWDIRGEFWVWSNYSQPYTPAQAALAARGALGAGAALLVLGEAALRKERAMTEWARINLSIGNYDEAVWGAVLDEVRLSGEAYRAALADLNKEPRS